MVLWWSVSPTSQCVAARPGHGGKFRLPKRAPKIIPTQEKMRLLVVTQHPLPFKRSSNATHIVEVVLNHFFLAHSQVESTSTSSMYGFAHSMFHSTYSIMGWNSDSALSHCVPPSTLWPHMVLVTCQQSFPPRIQLLMVSIHQMPLQPNAQP